MVSATRKCESALSIHIFRPSWNSLLPPTPSHPSRMSQGTRLSSLQSDSNFLLIKLVLWLFLSPLLSTPHSCPATGGPVLPLLWQCGIVLMLRSEVTLSKKHPGQKEPNEKVGSFVNVFFWGKVEKTAIKTKFLSCFSDLVGRRARGSGTLESVPDGKNSDATNIYWRLLDTKGPLGLFDKHLEGLLTSSRPHLNLPQALGTGIHCVPLFRKGHRGSRSQMACPRSLCYNFIQKWVSLHFEFHQM